MKAWEIVKRICEKLEGAELVEFSVKLQLGKMRIGTFTWKDKPNSSTLFMAKSFIPEFTDSTLNNYGKNKIIVDLFKALTDELNTETKEAEPNSSPEVAS